MPGKPVFEADRRENMAFWSPSKKAPEPKYIASIDQGTSSSRFMVFDKGGNVVSSYQQEHTQYYPRASWVEHDPEEIWEAVKTCISYGLYNGGITREQIVSLGITNQRETTVIFNKNTGRPYHNAIVWNDVRTTPICDEITSTGKGKYVTEKTGLPISCYFSATKIMYLLREVENLKEAVESGDAVFGTIDTWLLFKLTGGEAHKTDVTNAGRTMLMDLKTLQWDDSLLKIFGIPRSLLPEICSSSEVYGEVAVTNSGIPGLGGCTDLAGVRIAGILGDQHAALFGQTCFKKGEAKCTYGTGAFLMMNTGEEIIKSESGLLTTVGYQLGKDAKPIYALEGSVAYCGSLIQWLRDNLNIITDAAKSEMLASSVEDNGGVYFVPAFSGLFAPYWRSDARGIIAGLTAFNTKAHITRAALEAAAFQTNEILVAMQKDAGMKLPSLKVDGGMTKNGLLMQFQCDLIETSMSCPAMPETTAIGSAYAAALAVGFYESKEDVVDNWQLKKQWSPDMEEGKRAGLLRDWRKAVARSTNWVESSGSNGAARKKANDDLISALEDEDDSVTLSITINKGALKAAFLVAAVAGVAAFASKNGKLSLADVAKDFASLIPK